MPDSVERSRSASSDGDASARSHPRKLRRIVLFRSRVARRVFALFVVSALAPLVAFAVIALQRVDARLADEAAARLHRECRDAGMVFVGRISRAIHEFRLVGAGLAGPGAVPMARSDLLAARTFAAFDAYRPTELAGERTLDDRLRAVLTAAAERPTLDCEPAADGSATLRIVGRVRGRDGAELVCAARLDPDFAWEHGEMASESCDVAIEAIEPRRVLLHSSAGSWPASVAASPTDERSSREADWSEPDVPAIARTWTVSARRLCGASFAVTVRRPAAEAQAPRDAFAASFLATAALALGLIGLTASLLIRRTIEPLSVLRDAADRLGRQDFAARVELSTGDEFEDLGRTLNRAAGKLGRHAETMRAVNDFGRALSTEHDVGRLVARLADGAWTLFRADGCAVYLAEEDGPLRPAVFRVRSLDATFGPDDEPLPAAMIAADALAGGLPVNLADVRRDPRTAEACADFDRRRGYRTRTLLTVPFRDHENRLVGALQLFNATDASSGAPRLFDDEEADLASSVASQAGVAIANARLVREFRAMFDGVIELVATAIDEKSPYTGGHCRRVPELAMMIADEVDRADRGTFAGFRFSEEERYELRVAAMLHDCGKVATPVHVVDKATKLETIRDGIENVDVRFAVLRADARAAELRTALVGLGASGASAADEAEARAAAATAALEEDRTFLRRANTGGEFMTKADQERVRAIGARRWRDAAGRDAPLLSADEIANLCIARGTLNDAERAIINQHVTSTIRMLEKLPYPRSLRMVPQIAGAHHERMDGKGYPLGLKREDITLQGRILGVADIFEALTAKDRPYKPGRKLSESVAILRRMAAEGHVCPDLLELFLASKVYEAYGRRYLDADQVDDVPAAPTPPVADAPLPCGSCRG